MCKRMQRNDHGKTHHLRCVASITRFTSVPVAMKLCVVACHRVHIAVLYPSVKIFACAHTFSQSFCLFDACSNKISPIFYTVVSLFYVSQPGLAINMPELQLHYTKV